MQLFWGVSLHWINDIIYFLENITDPLVVWTIELVFSSVIKKFAWMWIVGFDIIVPLTEAFNRQRSETVLVCERVCYMQSDPHQEQTVKQLPWFQWVYNSWWYRNVTYFEGFLQNINCLLLVLGDFQEKEKQAGETKTIILQYSKSCLPSSRTRLKHV